MTVSDPESGIGFARVLPIYREGEQGGARIVKLLWDPGFEPFISTGQMYRGPLTSYLFVFQDGANTAIEQAMSIVDGLTD